MTGRRLLHYSDKPLGKIRSTSQKNSDFLMKPLGLWVSAEGEHDWKSWCAAESFLDIDCQHVQEIVLKPKAKVLRIETVRQLDDFHTKWATISLGWTDRCYPDWPKLAREYSGIIVSPFQWKRRMDGPASCWYYPWDCASGCIWDARAIEAVVPVRPPVKALA